jgi:hypothetical protein
MKLPYPDDMFSNCCYIVGILLALLIAAVIGSLMFIITLNPIISIMSFVGSFVALAWVFLP